MGYRGRRRTGLAASVAVLAATLVASCAGSSGGGSTEGLSGAFIVGEGGDYDPPSWARAIDDPARGVEVAKYGDGTWTVFVNVAEFLREDPLESEMRSSVARAIGDVSGVDAVYEEDREVWVVTGSPDGEQLLHAVGAVVDQLAPRAQAEIDRS